MVMYLHSDVSIDITKNFKKKKKQTTPPCLYLCSRSVVLVFESWLASGGSRRRCTACGTGKSGVEIRRGTRVGGRDPSRDGWFGLVPCAGPGDLELWYSLGASDNL